MKKNWYILFQGLVGIIISIIMILIIVFLAIISYDNLYGKKAFILSVLWVNTIFVLTPIYTLILNDIMYKIKNYK